MTMKLHFQHGEPYLYLANKCVEVIESEGIECYLGCTYAVEEGSFDDIADFAAGDLPDRLCINVSLWGGEYPYFDNARFARKRGEVILKGAVSYDVMGWDGDVNVLKLAATIADRLMVARLVEHCEISGSEGLITIFFTKKLDPIRTFREEVSVIGAFLSQAHREYQGSFELLSGVLTKIKVPHEYRHVFCQYLAYFGQFLTDMDIPAETTVASRGDHILLSVKPRDKDEAIQNIYLALAGYLALPDGDPLVIPAKDVLSQVRYQQLMANVEHLKTQLALTQAIVAVKNERISLLEAAGQLDLMRLALGGAEKPAVTPERWELMEGLALTKYKGPFFEIDIPRLIRRLTGKE